ncbi:MAG: hypothetical protein KatS3mg118_2716 [Paracoccaceae bacterium]|nr:MAG: hypothetical protein KatS3mg118_2716 [Paracoccaceae bacterium]
MKELILKVADEGDFLELQKDYARNIITGFIRLRGADGGRGRQPADGAGGLPRHRRSRKAARFVRSATAFEIPILTFVDVPGFLPGTAQEYGGIIKHGAKLLFAYRRGDRAQGHRDHAQGLRRRLCRDEHQALRGDVNYAWPSAEIAVMGAKGAVEILYRAELGDPRRSRPARAGLRGPLRQPVRRGRSAASSTR